MWLYLANGSLIYCEHESVVATSYGVALCYRETFLRFFFIIGDTELDEVFIWKT